MIGGRLFNLHEAWNQSEARTVRLPTMNASRHALPTARVGLSSGPLRLSSAPHKKFSSTPPPRPSTTVGVRSKPSTLARDTIHNLQQQIHCLNHALEQKHPQAPLEGGWIEDDDQSSASIQRVVAQVEREHRLKLEQEEERREALSEKCHTAELSASRHRAERERAVKEAKTVEAAALAQKRELVAEVVALQRELDSVNPPRPLPLPNPPRPPPTPCVTPPNQL